MNPASYFAASYGEARAKFLSAAESAGATVSRHVHPTERGAEGEELSIDLAILGEPDAPGLLLLISGTHGAEGFAARAARWRCLTTTIFGPISTARAFAC